MADSNNPGQFQNRKDQTEVAREGGKASAAKQDMSALGKMGAEAQPTEAKAKGGQNSHKNG